MPSHKPTSKTVRSAESENAMMQRNSTLDIDLYRCEPLNSEIVGMNITIGHLPNETEINIQMLGNAPMSMMTYSFFKTNIDGQKFNWLNGQEIYFPDSDRHKPSCYMPIGEDTSVGCKYPAKITFQKTKGGLCKLLVWGVAEVPLFIGGIPLRIPVMLVENLPLHLTLFDDEMPDMLMLAHIFNKWTIPLYFHSVVMEYRPDYQATIQTSTLPNTGDIALEILADVVTSSGHQRGEEYDYGYGIWFGKDSVYNIAGSMISVSPTATEALELRGALQVAYRVRNMCTYTFSALDFTDVVVYCTSEYVVKWAPEWAKHCDNKRWVMSLQMSERSKKIWGDLIEAQRAARRTFHWVYLEKEHNKAAALATSGCIGLNGESYQILTNEPRNKQEIRNLLKGNQRPGKFFESMCLEGGMCRNAVPKGFYVETCCPCSDTLDSWETNLHY